MIVEGVNFNEKKVKSMKKKVFIDECLKVFFQDRSEDKRRQILSDIYDKIKGVSKVEVDLEGGGGL